MRCGASKNEKACSVAQTIANQLTLACDRFGGNPNTVNGTSGKPEATSAVSGALAPGTGSTAIPFEIAACTSSRPGSEIPGVPASVTTATLEPASRRLISCGTRDRAL